MNSRQHYICEYHLHTDSGYFIWFQDEVDGVVLDENGLIITFNDIVDAITFTSKEGLALNREATGHYDLNRVLNWCNYPTAETINCKEFLEAWNLFEDMCPRLDAAVSLFGYVSKMKANLYDKLFFGNNLPSITPEGEQYRPQWEKDEVIELQRILRQGLTEFQIRLKRPAA